MLSSKSQASTKTYLCCSSMCQGRRGSDIICKLQPNRNRFTSRVVWSCSTCNTYMGMTNLGNYISYTLTYKVHQFGPEFCSFAVFKTLLPLQWRHNECYGVSKHQLLDCLLNWKIAMVDDITIFQHSDNFYWMLWRMAQHYDATLVFRCIGNDINLSLRIVLTVTSSWI